MVLPLIGDDSIITMGFHTHDIPQDRLQATWLAELARRSGSSHARRKRCGDTWTTDIPVSVYVVSLKSAAKPDKEGLLQPLLRSWQAGRTSFSVFALPPVQAVIDFKWHTYAMKLMFIEMSFYLLWVFAFYAFTAAFQDEDVNLTFKELLQTSRGRFTLTMDLLALIGMMPFIFIELATLTAYGFRGWFTAWNVLDMLTYINQILIVAMHVGRFATNSEYVSILAALQCLLLLFRFQFFTRCLPQTRFSFVDDLKEVIGDVRWYLVFISAIVMGYAGK